MWEAEAEGWDVDSGMGLAVVVALGLSELLSTSGDFEPFIAPE